MTKLSQKLDAVSKAKQAYVLARTTLEQRLRDQMRAELGNLQTQIDIAVRYAVDAGESKAAILRALGTKDYNTVKASLDRTQGVTEVVGADPLAGVYTLLPGEYMSIETGEATDAIRVIYNEHGPNDATGVSDFDFRTLEDGRVLLTAHESLWNDDYTVRNDAVAFLDGKMDGYYYDELVEWLKQS